MSSVVETSDTSVEDLPGHRFGVPALNSQIWLDLRTAVDEAGGDSSKIKWVETGRTGIEPLRRQPHRVR